MWLVGLLLTLSVAASDDKALSIESEMMEAMGGRANWEQARFVRFTLVRGNRTPIFSWDRWTGQLRIESRNAQGIPFVILMNVKTRQGQAYLDGRALEGKELSEHVNLGYRMWAGGTYWFLMPFKWRDEGVVLAYDGEETIDGEVYDRIHLSFDNVGRSPGDQYWAWVNRKTHLMDRWKFKLEGGAERVYRWTGWRRFGGLRVATERIGDEEEIRFEDIFFGDSMPREIFTSPKPVEFP